MPTLTVTDMIAGTAISDQFSNQITSGCLIRIEVPSGDCPPVPKGFDGDLTTRTSDSAGVATLDSAGHGLTTSDKADAFWYLDGTPYRRTGLTIAAVNGAAVSVSGGAGDNLPLQGTPIILAKVGALTIRVPTVDISAAKYISLSCDRPAVIRTNSATSPQETIHLKAGEYVSWSVGNGAAPFAGDVTSLHVSCAGGNPNETITDGSLKFTVLQDPTV